MASADLIILVKAPNQLIGDQKITCQRNWTVKQLKEHLFEVYPNRPLPKDQKLIYSGQLLTDTTLLSDVIKTYNGQEINTIHLVCAVKVSVNPIRPHVGIESPAPATTNVTTNPTQPSPLQASSDASSTRPEPTENTGCYYPSMLTNPPWYSCPINRLSGNRNAESQEDEFEWVHQAYINYLNSYLRMTELMYNIPLTHDSDDTSSGTDGEGFVERPAGVEQDDGAAQIHPQPAAVGENEEEDEHFNRDLLEWIYIYFRFGVLFMFVYFYSSPIRFLLVVTMMVLLYRLRYGPQDEPVVEGAGPADEEQVNGNPPAPQQNNWLSMAWTFVSLFFLSLIPDLIN
ncbi:homocysteine-responsive endoplasmic reticulum-resident ubiquitin-like domain member 2 protein isoform X2 [Cimex lectularius]|uniref:Ubiquitin-like domain-containing protein n=1 Tax=Cimex lectularius TaxID=79782 RepID=A0A8I6RQY0_CIMLE|nr:homocysteine-responsive endoplasmic reticulum-resident ubiquitin-like domain member 2 protein isoform X2 [Cimex lectularius]